MNEATLKLTEEELKTLVEIAPDEELVLKIRAALKSLPRPLDVNDVTSLNTLIMREAKFQIYRCAGEWTVSIEGRCGACSSLAEAINRAVEACRP